VLLVHGYPELAFSWRKVMSGRLPRRVPCVRPRSRGYGGPPAPSVKFDDDLAPFRTLNEVRDMVGLVSAMGYRSVAAVVGQTSGRLSPRGAPLSGRMSSARWC
jgi:pimeloyl-ACP methyl ester carboxylesterase